MKKFINIFENIVFPGKKRWICAVGVFDGVHPGHRAIIAAARKRADGCDAGVMALTFIPHPRKLLDAKNAPPLLVSETKRVELLLEAGADCCGYIDFTPESAALEPLEFLSALRDNGIFEVCGICVGEKWRFGKMGKGDRMVLADFCAENDWTLDTVKELTLDGITISSTAIRQALAAGDVDYASRLWGCPVEVNGIVEHGFRIAGSKLAAPTANLQTAYLLPLPFGVYSGKAALDGKIYPAVLNIGTAPTFGHGLRRVEIHLLDFTGDLYGRELTVKLLRFIRPERKFASPDELKKQIVADIEAARSDNAL